MPKTVKELMELERRLRERERVPRQVERAIRDTVPGLKLDQMGPEQMAEEPIRKGLAPNPAAELELQRRLQEQEAAQRKQEALQRILKQKELEDEGYVRMGGSD
jgi:hypothetical protein